MNREILFKGKRTDNGEWVEGDLIREQDIFGKINTRIYQIKGDGAYQKHDVDPETICQYTGLTDNNGTKIWENDIVKIHIFTEYGEGCGRHRNEVGVICYDSIGMLSVRTELYDEKPCYSDILHEICLADVEFELKVIGNLFDNPELMGGVS